jgi:hypothetical protein
MFQPKTPIDENTPMADLGIGTGEIMSGPYCNIKIII